VRDNEFAILDVNGLSRLANIHSPVLVPSGAVVQKLAGGFSNISGAAADNHGDVYFADPRPLRIYRWSVAQERVEQVCEVPERPEQLAFDQAGNLLVVAYEGGGTVLSFCPTNSDESFRRLQPLPAEPRVGMVPVLPVSRWMGTGNFLSDSTLRKPYHYLSPDGTTFIPAGPDFIEGAVSWGIKSADLLRTFGLAPALEEQRFFVCNEAEQQTWSFKVSSDGTLSDPKLFVEEGGEAVTVDSQGRVYLAAGQIRVFSPKGDPINVIQVPERPTCLVFGGPDRKTLFITARSSLYSVNVR